MCLIFWKAKHICLIIDGYEAHTYVYSKEEVKSSSSDGNHKLRSVHLILYLSHSVFVTVLLHFNLLPM